MVIQLLYPANRIAVTTASKYNVYYTLPQDAPIELRRAYKLLEVAEREVLITEALQLFRAEIVANERRLEAAKTAKMAAYLNGTDSTNKVFTQESSIERVRNRIFSSQTLLYVDPTLTMAVPESSFKVELGRGLAYDAQVERAVTAINRMAEAQYQLRLTLVALAYPDTSDRPLVRKPGKLEVVPSGTTDPAPNPPRSARPAVTPAAPAPTALDEALRFERVSAAAEVIAEDRARQAQATERAAAAYRSAAPADQARTREAWLSARNEWELARRDWAETRENWLSARYQLELTRSSSPGSTASSVASLAENTDEPGVAADLGSVVDRNLTPTTPRRTTQPVSQTIVNPLPRTANITVPNLGSTAVPRVVNPSPPRVDKTYTPTISITPLAAGISPVAPRIANAASPRVVPDSNRKSPVTRKK